MRNERRRETLGIHGQKTCKSGISSLGSSQPEVNGSKDPGVAEARRFFEGLSSWDWYDRKIDPISPEWFFKKLSMHVVHTCWSGMEESIDCFLVVTTFEPYGLMNFPYFWTTFGPQLPNTNWLGITNVSIPILDILDLISEFVVVHTVGRQKNWDWLTSKKKKKTINFQACVSS